MLLLQTLAEDAMLVADAAVIAVAADVQVAVHANAHLASAASSIS